MLRTCLLGTLVSATLGVASFAAAPPPSPVTREVWRLIDQLGDRDQRSRDLAERRLLKIGPGALPWVRDASRSRDAEVRRRAFRLLGPLEESLLFAPRRLTFSVRNQPLDKVIEALKKASGYNIYNNSGGPAPGFLAGLFGPKQKTYRYDFVDVPFWEVVDRIGRDAGLTLQQNWGQDVIWLTSGGQPAHVNHFGPFRCTASSFQLSRSLDLSRSNLGPGGGRTDSLTLQFDIWAEPRLPFVRGGTARLTAAYDEFRASMLPAGTGAGNSMADVSYGARPMHMRASAHLERRSARARKLKLLRGVLPVDVLVNERPIVIAEKILQASGKKKMVGDLEFHVEQAQKANNHFNLQFSVGSKDGNFAGMHYLYNRITVYDTKGKVLSWNSAGSWTSGNRAGVHMTYPLPGKDTTPGKVVFQHWETRRCEIPFTFRDVPLP